MTILSCALALLLSQVPPQNPKGPKVTVAAIVPGSPEVRPGEPFTVTFELEIQEKYHIYPFERTSPVGKAPQVVIIGAEKAGPLEQPAPKIKKDEALGPYQYFEGNITLRIPLRLPAQTPSGPLELKGGFLYQICDENLCHENTTPFSFTISVAGGAPAPPPKPGKVTATVESIRPQKSDVHVGETFKVDVEISIPAGWHIYPADQKQVTGLPTDFVLDEAERAGRVDQPPGVRYKEEGVGEYEFLEGKVHMAVPVRLKDGAKPGPFEVQGKMVYQICQTEGLCIQGQTPVRFSVTVLEGKVAAAPVEDGSYEGVGGLIVLGILGGLISLVMPCTYPIIPITLTYFVKQAAGSRAHGLFLSTLFSLGIILSFTGIGFAMSILLGPGGARIFAANPWVNIVVASMFLWFAGSLFGWYEIRLPGSLGQLAGGQKKGVGGAFLLGLLFAVVTFTCTIPIAGTILTTAAGQHRFAALLAMLAYSMTMAFPFFLMGLFPGLIKEVPRGGGWLHQVKVSMGFVEVAIASFYFSKADQAWDFGLLNRWVILAIYVLSSAVVAVYLLGFFRARPTGAKVVFALVFLSLAGFFGSGFTGRALGTAEGFIPPPPIHSTTLPLALGKAKTFGKPVFAEFTGVSCSNCQANRGTILADPRVTELLKGYVVAELYTDRVNPMDQENNALLNEKYGAALPLYVLFSPDGIEIGRLGGRPSLEAFIAFLKKGLDRSAARASP